LTHEDISKQFGSTVAELVEGVTKLLTRVQYTSKEDEQMEKHAQDAHGHEPDIRVILKKLPTSAQYAHNGISVTRQAALKIAGDNGDLPPIAHRLGMQRVKWELEDLSLLYLDPVGYKEITDALNAKMEMLESFMKSVETSIQERMDESGISCTISGRIKHIYSIYRKMFAQKKDIDEIFDLCAFRVIVASIADCYNVLGLIHDMYKPIPGRFKDYISTPKPNLYQSIPTTVIGSEGIPFEVQKEHGICTTQPKTAIRPLEIQVRRSGRKVGDEEQVRMGACAAGIQQDSDAQDFFHDSRSTCFPMRSLSSPRRETSLTSPSGQLR
jgi:GTP pyrophosphokinase